jgi:hypothetical protein
MPLIKGLAIDQEVDFGDHANMDLPEDGRQEEHYECHQDDLYPAEAAPVVVLDQASSWVRMKNALENKC